MADEESLLAISREKEERDEVVEDLTKLLEGAKISRVTKSPVVPGNLAIFEKMRQAKNIIVMVRSPLYGSDGFLQR